MNGNIAITIDASTSKKSAQRIRPRSLKRPKSGLLTADARKSPERMKPVVFGLNPWACCRKSEQRLAMPEPPKSRRLKKKPVARKKSHSALVGKSFPLGIFDFTQGTGSASSSASQQKIAAKIKPIKPSSNTGARQECDIS